MCEASRRRARKFLTNASSALSKQNVRRTSPRLQVGTFATPALKASSGTDRVIGLHTAVSQCCQFCDGDAAALQLLSVVCSQSGGVVP
jgi:hypothetical protein